MTRGRGTSGGGAGNIYIGTSGWSYPDWRGIVYPKERPARFHELPYLARFLDAVEINTSFYRPPPARMTQRWVELVADRKRFLFTAKLYQRFTHACEEPWSATEAQVFKEGMRPLVEAGRLGALLLQFPWSFQADDANRDWLARLGGEFAQMRCVVEVRHATWDAPENHEFLRRHRLSFCNIDQPRSSTGIGRTNLITGPVAYYRLHGRNAKAWFKRDADANEKYNYLYNEKELAPWVEEIASATGQVEQIFVMNNNHYKGQALVNALELRSLLTEEPVAAPPELVAAYPILLNYTAAPTGQGNLAF